MSEKKSKSERVSSVPPFGLRMLPELRERLAEVAKANGRSMNAEIVSRLEDSIDHEAALGDGFTLHFKDQSLINLPPGATIELKVNKSDKKRISGTLAVEQPKDAAVSHQKGQKGDDLLDKYETKEYREAVILDEIISNPDGTGAVVQKRIQEFLNRIEDLQNQLHEVEQSARSERAARSGHIKPRGTQKPLIHSK